MPKYFKMAIPYDNQSKIIEEGSIINKKDYKIITAEDNKFIVKSIHKMIMLSEHIYIEGIYETEELKYWEITKINKTDDGEPTCIKFKSKDDEAFKVSYKWDGCINYHEADGGYIHICDTYEMIERLEELNKIAEDIFPYGIG